MSVVTKKFGSLYFDGQPVDVGSRYDEEVITFGDTVPGKEITWVEVNGLLIADRCVCVNISWLQLSQMGYTFGREVTIDGRKYLCRLLKVGAAPETPNEWDDALDATTEDNAIWHWKNCFFWGQETDKAYTFSRAVRGCSSARYWSNRTASYRRVYVGFRPALVPLPIDTLTSDAPIKTYVALYNETKVYIGIFKAKSEQEAEKMVAEQENCDRAAIRAIEVPMA